MTQYFGVALMLQRVTRFKAIYFAILTIPMAMSPVAVGLIWHMLLQPNLGIVNEVLKTWSRYRTGRPLSLVTRQEARMP